MTDVYVVAEIFGGVLHELTVFDTKEKAQAYAEQQAKEYDFKQEDTDRWTSQDEDDDMTLWKVQVE